MQANFIIKGTQNQKKNYRNESRTITTAEE